MVSWRKCQGLKTMKTGRIALTTFCRICDKSSSAFRVGLRAFASRPQQRDNRPPFGRIIAGSLRCGIGAGSAPKLLIESGLGGAEFHMPVSPKNIDTVWVLVAGMGQGAPGVN